MAEMIVMKGDVTLRKSEAPQSPHWEIYSGVQGKTPNIKDGTLRTSHLVSFALYLVKPFAAR